MSEKSKAKTFKTLPKNVVFDDILNTSVLDDQSDGSLFDEAVARALFGKHVHVCTVELLSNFTLPLACSCVIPFHVEMQPRDRVNNVFSALLLTSLDGSSFRLLNLITREVFDTYIKDGHIIVNESPVYVFLTS